MRTTSDAHRRAPPRAFTLLEMSAAMACMGILALAATMVLAMYLQMNKRARQQTYLLARSRSALEYVLDEARRAGGSGMPPTASVLVEEDCGPRRGLPACPGTSDRISIVQPLAGYARCVIERDEGGSSVKVKKLKSRGGGADACCLTDTGFSRQVAFVSAGQVSPVYLRSTGACTFSYSPLWSDPPFALDGAQIFIADVKTFYLEAGATDTGRLTMHVELDGNPGVVGERLYLANGLLDFQARQTGPMLGLSVVAGIASDRGVTSYSTAFSAPRALAFPYMVHEATARVSLRNTR